MTGSNAAVGLTVQRAIEVAARLFAERGYGETTTRQISTALGVTNGTFYHHFRSKQDLLRTICEAVLADLQQRVEVATAGSGTARDRVVDLIHTHVETITAARAGHVTMLTEARALQGEDRDRVVAARDRYEDLVRSVVTAGQDAGHLRSDTDAATMTRLLLNLLNWTIFWYRPDGDLAAEELAAQMTQLFLEGAERRA